jgi:hypothetical protein
MAHASDKRGKLLNRSAGLDFNSPANATVPVRRLCLVLVGAGRFAWLLLLLLPRYNASVVRGWPPLVSTVSNVQLYQENLTTNTESELHVVGLCVETHLQQTSLLTFFAYTTKLLLRAAAIFQAPCRQWHELCMCNRSLHIFAVRYYVTGCVSNCCRCVSIIDSPFNRSRRLCELQVY